MPCKPIVQIRRATLAVIVTACASITGCASTYNSGVLVQGTDAYYVRIRLPTTEGGSRAAKEKAVAQADEYCSGKTGKKAIITLEELGPVTADIYFSCIGPAEL
jgi:hypothetical protein